LSFSIDVRVDHDRYSGHLNIGRSFMASVNMLKQEPSISIRRGDEHTRTSKLFQIVNQEGAKCNDIITKVFNLERV
jgi:hypothetical protein